MVEEVIAEKSCLFIFFLSLLKTIIIIQSKKKKNLYKSDAQSSTVRSCNANMSHIFTLPPPHSSNPGSVD